MKKILLIIFTLSISSGCFGDGLELVSLSDYIAMDQKYITDLDCVFELDGDLNGNKIPESFKALKSNEKAILRIEEGSNIIFEQKFNHSAFCMVPKKNLVWVIFTFESDYSADLIWDGFEYKLLPFSSED